MGYLFEYRTFISFLRHDARSTFLLELYKRAQDLISRHLIGDSGRKPEGSHEISQEQRQLCAQIIAWTYLLPVWDTSHYQRHNTTLRKHIVHVSTDQMIVGRISILHFWAGVTDWLGWKCICGWVEKDVCLYARLLACLLQWDWELAWEGVLKRED
ncbi:hypothetical protein VTL71DRAFT_14310 [Oculimacula yallundae]|uniref:Uncharacterized protein n=1 Tax=Oculimacula yallundae TaxID=86028 RepID=A0ABR4CK81_9HELO